MSNIKWVFFDLDGTLVDSIPSLYRAYLDFLADYGIKGSKKEFEKLNGPSLKEIVFTLKNEHKLNDSNKKLFTNYIKKIQTTYKKTKPKKHSRHVLQTLSENGYKLALVSSSPRNLVTELLRRYGWKKFFIRYVFGNEVTHSKPYPDIYNLCLKKTKAGTKQTIAVEDSKNGFKSATKAGLRCILLNKKVKLHHIIEMLNDHD